MLPLTHIVSAFRHRNFRTYVSGNAVSLVGMWTQRVAVGWLTWELTHSGAWLGAVAFADLCPSIVVGPFAGVLADRADRLRIIRVAQTLSMIQAATLAVLTAGGWIDIEILLVLVFFNGIVIGFNQPSRLALVSSLVPRHDLSTAVAVNAIVFNLARFIGPAVSGGLILAYGAAAAFGVNAVTFLAFLVALTRVRLEPDVAPVRGAPDRSVLAEIAEGIRYIGGHAGIGPMLLLFTAIGIGVRGYVELLPGFSAEVFGRGAGGLATLASAIGIGAIGGGLWLAQRGSRGGLERVAMVHSLLAALAVLAFAATDRFWVAVACAALSGTFMTVGGVATQTVVQSAVAPAVRGRVLSVYGIIIRAGPAAGALVVGGVSEITGLRAPLIAAACACIVVWLAVWRRRGRVGAALAEPRGS